MRGSKRLLRRDSPEKQCNFIPNCNIGGLVRHAPHCGIHRTFLAFDGLRQANFQKPKRALDLLGTAAVRLFSPKNGILGLSEGTESAMSAIQITGIPTWATLGNDRFGIVTIPESVKELHPFVDNDAGGDLAEAKAREHLLMPGRSLIARRPQHRDDDWNDELFRYLAATT